MHVVFYILSKSVILQRFGSVNWLAAIVVLINESVRWIKQQIHPMAEINHIRKHNNQAQSVKKHKISHTKPSHVSMWLRDFTSSCRQDTESFITVCSFCTLQAEIYITRYMDAPGLTKRIRGNEERRMETRIITAIRKHKSWSGFCDHTGNTALGSPNGRKQTEERKNWAK